MCRITNLSLVALCGIVFAGCAGSSEPTSRKKLVREFQAEFGFPPSNQITELRCKIVWVGDTWNKWMLFTLDEATVQAIIGAGFVLADSASLERPWEKLWTQDLTREAPNPNAPKWWQIPGAKKVRVYYREGHPKDLAGYKYLWIDGDTKTVYAKSSAWH
jgi:hypothetical protein